MPDYYDNVDEQEDFSRVETDPQLEPAQGLNKSQKTAVVLLAFFALLVIVMWGYQFKRALNAPFEYKGPSAYETAPVCADGNCEADGNDLRNQDTDGDGLSDYDELNFYKTSPYLEDSDSDGYTDKNEIDSDNDPNCPIGQDCYGEVESTLVPLETNNYEDISPYQDSEDMDLSEILTPDMDANTLRALLIEAGVEPSILEQVSDEQLLSTYRETLQAN
jgi:hypothetical protein